jgi:hypothetical protein
VGACRKRLYLGSRVCVLGFRLRVWMPLGLLQLCPALQACIWNIRLAARTLKFTGVPWAQTQNFWGFPGPRPQVSWAVFPGAQTNNPRKIRVLRELGVVVTARLPCIVQSQQFNEGYLNVKQARMQHDLDGSFCYWNHDGEPLRPSSARAGGDAVPPVPRTDVDRTVDGV